MNDFKVTYVYKNGELIDTEDHPVDSDEMSNLIVAGIISAIGFAISPSAYQTRINGKIIAEYKSGELTIEYNITPKEAIEEIHKDLLIQYPAKIKSAT